MSTPLLEDEVARLKAQAAAMRAALEAYERACDACGAGSGPEIEAIQRALEEEWNRLRRAALATDAGKDFVPRAKLEEARAQVALLARLESEQFEDWCRVSEQAAVMREALDWGLLNCRSLTGGDERRFRDALATDAGRGWLSPEQVTALKEAVVKACCNLVNRDVRNTHVRNHLLKLFRDINLSKIGSTGAPVDGGLSEGK